MYLLMRLERGWAMGRVRNVKGVVPRRYGGLAGSVRAGPPGGQPGRDSAPAAAGLELAPTAAGAGVVAAGLEPGDRGAAIQVGPAAPLAPEARRLLQHAEASPLPEDGPEMHLPGIALLAAPQHLQAQPAGGVVRRQLRRAGARMPARQQVVGEVQGEGAIAGAHQRLRGRSGLAGMVRSEERR